MSVQHEKTFEITANGLAPWTAIPPGLTKVWVGYGSGAAGTVLPKCTPRPDDAYKIFPVKMNGDAISISSNDVFDVNGPGYLSFESSGVSGTIEVIMQSAEPVR